MISCASPISARIAAKTGSRVAGPQGSGRPACAISEKSPAVFRTTVLPPALGPETTSRRFSAGSSRSSGTISLARAGRAAGDSPSARNLRGASRGSSSGWRAAAIVQLPSSESSGILAAAFSPNSTFASSASSAAICATASSRSSPAARTSWPKPASSLSTSRRSSPASRARSLLDSMTSIGSTKTVWPDPERSCTMPGTRARADARTGRQ